MLRETLKDCLYITQDNYISLAAWLDVEPFSEARYRLPRVFIFCFGLISFVQE